LGFCFVYRIALLLRHWRRRQHAGSRNGYRFRDSGQCLLPVPGDTDGFDGTHCSLDRNRSGVRRRRVSHGVRVLRLCQSTDCQQVSDADVDKIARGQTALELIVYQWKFIHKPSFSNRFRVVGQHSAQDLRFVVYTRKYAILVARCILLSD
jgi:hypothetical protein